MFETGNDSRPLLADAGNVDEFAADRQQACSIDDGASWETDWIMRMTREGAAP